jgi:hypothetical protein
VTTHIILSMLEYTFDSFMMRELVKILD